MPHKKNTNGCHHIPKMRHSVTNWAEYDAGLRRRGSLTMWITKDAIAGWAATRRATPGGQATRVRKYSVNPFVRTATDGKARRKSLRNGDVQRFLIEMDLVVAGASLAAPDHLTDEGPGSGFVADCASVAGRPVATAARA